MRYQTLKRPPSLHRWWPFMFWRWGFRLAYLEDQSYRKLHVARAAAAKEWIACSNIRCRRDWQEVDASAGCVDSILQEIHTEVWPQRIREVWMIEQIEHIHAGLQVHAI